MGQHCHRRARSCRELYTFYGWESGWKWATLQPLVHGQEFSVICTSGQFYKEDPFKTFIFINDGGGEAGDFNRTWED